MTSILLKVIPTPSALEANDIVLTFSFSP